MELRDADQAQNGYAFALSYVQSLNEQAMAQTVTFDGRVVVIPGVFSEGKTAPMRLELRDGAFQVP